METGEQDNIEHLILLPVGIYVINKVRRVKLSMGYEKTRKDFSFLLDMIPSKQERLPKP